MTIRLVEIGLFSADRRTYMTNLIVAFSKFAKSPKNSSLMTTILGIY